jgi:hypothetical protein
MLLEEGKFLSHWSDFFIKAMIFLPISPFSLYVAAAIKFDIEDLIPRFAAQCGPSLCFLAERRLPVGPAIGTLKIKKKNTAL